MVGGSGGPLLRNCAGGYHQPTATSVLKVFRCLPVSFVAHGATIRQPKCGGIAFVSAIQPTKPAAFVYMHALMYDALLHCYFPISLYHS